MLWLFDSAMVALGVVPNYDSIVTIRRFREHSEWSGRFPVSAYDALSSAAYAIVADEPEVYLIERPILKTGLTQCVEVFGRSASALLSTRTIEGTKNWVASTAGAMIANMMADFTGARALAISFGTGASLGAAFSLQKSWGDCGDHAIQITAAQGLGLKTRFDGTGIKLDVYAAADTGLSLGEAYGDGSTAALSRDDVPWKNYAYVLGEGDGAARVQVSVDQTSGNPRRELYVDARDLAQGTMTLAEYQSVLSARGASKLAETRRVESAQATDVEALILPGDIVYYDASHWRQSFMTTELKVVREGGSIKRTPTFGEPVSTLKTYLRRING